MAANFQDQMTCIALVEPDAYPSHQGSEKRCSPAWCTSLAKVIESGLETALSCHGWDW